MLSGPVRNGKPATAHPSSQVRCAVTALRRPIARHLIEAWLASCCRLGRGEWEHAGPLYDSWRQYAHRQREEPGSPAEFADEMERRGFEVDQVPPLSRGRIRWGLRLR